MGVVVRLVLVANFSAMMVFPAPESKMIEWPGNLLIAPTQRARDLSPLLYQVMHAKYWELFLLIFLVLALKTK